MTDLCYNQHWVYSLTCEQFNEIHNRQTGRCGVCGIEELATTGRQLCIDHDSHRGYWAVRGLLCGPCNLALAGLAGTPAAVQYVAESWWKTLPTPMREPPVGTVLRGRWGGRWTRGVGGWTGSRHGEVIRDWAHVVSACGPYLRLWREPNGTAHVAPIRTKQRLPSAECLSKKKIVGELLSPDQMTKEALIAEVRRLRRLLAGTEAVEWRDRVERAG